MEEEEEEEEEEKINKINIDFYVSPLFLPFLQWLLPSFCFFFTSLTSLCSRFEKKQRLKKGRNE